MLTIVMNLNYDYFEAWVCWRVTSFIFREL